MTADPASAHGSALPRSLDPEFFSNVMARRLRTLANEPLLQAVGIKRGKMLQVVDATAGLGRDAFILAAAGAEVTLVDRSREAFEALSARMEEARRSGEPWASAANRMTLIHADAREVLARLRSDVVVVDPMHPARKKSSLQKQPMRVLREMVGPDEDAGDLMLSAIRSGTRRVVVKWPARAAAPSNLPKPTFEIVRKTIRYIVFETGPPEQDPGKTPL